MRNGRKDHEQKEQFWDHSRWTEHDDLDNEVRDRLSQVKSREVLRRHHTLRADPEFSGLVDIRALANATRSELQVDGNVITLTGLPTAAAQPPVLPVQDPGTSTQMVVGLSALALAAMGLLVLIGVLLFGSDGRSAGPDPGGSPQLAALMLAAVDLPTEGELAPPPASTPPAATGVVERAGALKPAPAASRTKTTAVKPQRKRDRKSARKLWRNDELDSLLAGALESRAKRPERRRGAERSAKRPSTLTRSQVRSGLSKARSRVKRKCGKGRDGVVTVEVVIGNNGRISRARPTGTQAGTSAGKCVARAVRKARFPKFSGQRITVNYPFRL